MANEETGKYAEMIEAKTIELTSRRPDPVEEVKSIYAHRIIHAVSFNKKYGSDRRAMGEFVDLETLKKLPESVNKFHERLNNPRSKQWGDIFILYLVEFDRNKIEEGMAFIEDNPPRDPHVMVAIPNEDSELDALLPEVTAARMLIKAAETEEEKEGLLDVYDDLMNRLRDSIIWNNWTWFYKGEILDVNTSLSDTAIISDFMSKLYPYAFNPGHRALGLHHHFPHYARKDVKKAVDRILDLHKPLIISNDPLDHPSKVLKAAAELGLLVRKSQPDWEEEWTVREEPSADSPIKGLWKFLYTDVVGKSQAGEEIPFKKIMEKFLSPPWGVTRAAFKVFFSLFLRLYKAEIKLYHYNKGKRHEVNNLTFQKLTDMMRHVENWKVGMRRETEEEEKYLKSLAEQIKTVDNTINMDDSIWDGTRDVLFGWFDSLPLIIPQREFENEKVKNLLNAFKHYRDKNARDFLMINLPEALGKSGEDFDLEKDAEEAAQTLGEIVKAVDEMKIKIEDEVWERIAKLFAIKEDEADKFQEFMKAWFKKIEAERFSEYFRGDAEALYKACRTEGDLKERFLVNLLKDMKIGTVQEWKTDRTEELIARLDKARFQMSVIKYLRVKDLSNEDRRKEFISEWFLEVMNYLEFDIEESENFLERYLEEIISS